MAILDYGVSNLCSVVRTLEYLGFDVLLTSDPADLPDAPRLIVPGQGDFTTAMRNLETSGLGEALDRERRSGKPIMGIGIGMQIMSKQGTENGACPGLGWIDAVCQQLSVGARMLVSCENSTEPALYSDLPIPISSLQANTRIDREFPSATSRLKLPHVGWNDLCFGERMDPLFGGIKPQDSSVYFAHSYALACENAIDVIATCEHGEPFVAAVRHENLFATQFHPEKSQDNGIRILDNFMNWNP